MLIIYYKLVKYGGANRMIVKIKDNVIFKNKNPIEIEKNDSQIRNIKKYYNEFIKQNSGVYNGNVYCITNIIKQNDEFIFEVGKTKFEDIVYSKKHLDLKTRCLFVGTYFITIDGCYCIIKNNRNIVNLIGGMADETDFENGNFNPNKCLNREVKEEVGLDIEKKKDFINISLKYIKMPSEEEEALTHYPIGLIYETTLNMTYNELKNKFNKNQNITDGEIKEIISIQDVNTLKKYEKKASYLIELFECIRN